ncbi:glycerophosphodiester phosphodiesterase [Halomonas campisalis]|uniref:Glycerophosphodiester phosphodiesterase n=1 Tax=Billgrantia campisalis TaxID=74661 RepID=A0ABS9PAN2_9GAMM|nr:glycerophosphodiester phosphodiesterase [Halomonas campisalis]MCG6658849.1 glycerophosphodiester phosphodiesterase [Halomonas campisalis]MDR5864502.1 glycerophosphodiester phosphodiesterase [Halomonas campisalis]
MTPFRISPLSLRYALAALGTATLIAPATADTSPLQQQLDDLQAFQVIAHRGASGHAPEQTLPALELAHEMGVDYLELDIQMTADGELVAFHDERIDRTTDGEGELRDFTLESLKALDAGSWFNAAYPDYADEAYAGVEILTLGEVIEHFGTEMRYYLETKSPELYPGLEEAMVEELEAHGLVESGSVIIQSFSQESLQKVHALNADIPLVQLVWYYPESDDSERLVEWTGVTPGPSEITDADFQAMGEYAVGIGTNLTYQDDLQVIDAAFIEQAQANDLLVHVYTVNDPAEMQKLLDWGVDGIFTDFPDRLNALVD